MRHGLGERGTRGGSNGSLSDPRAEPWSAQCEAEHRGHAPGDADAGRPPPPRARGIFDFLFFFRLEFFRLEPLVAGRRSRGALHGAHVRFARREALRVPIDALVNEELLDIRVVERSGSGCNDPR